MKRMFRHSSTFGNQNGSALLMLVILLPVATLICIFAFNMAYRDIAPTTNDKCYRNAFFHADGAVYGCAKLISNIAKSRTREKIETDHATDVNAGGSMDWGAPGIEYKNDAADPAEAFVLLLESPKVNETEEDVAFVGAVKSMVDIRRNASRNPFGGGAEFGSASEGIGAQSNVIVYQLRSKSGGSCNLPAGSGVDITADYWLLVGPQSTPKGI
jgi:hypothetical protein